MISPSAGLRTAPGNPERGQIPTDIRRIERRPIESDKGTWCAVLFRMLSQRRGVEIRLEHCHRGFEGFGADGCLSPTHHLRIEPGGLDGIGPRGLLASDQEVAAALADRALRRNLQPPFERALDDFGIDAD